MLRFLVLWRAATPATRGIALMVVSTLLFSAMHAMVRHVTAEVHPIQAAFFRSLFGLVVFLPFLLRRGWGLFRTERLALHGLRAAMNCLAMFAFFIGLSITPLADATALGFTAPIFAAIFATMILGERFRLRRWAAIGLGFLGTLVILRPGLQALSLGPLLVLGSSIMWAATMTVIKILTRTESVVTITTYMNVLLALLGFVPTLFLWQTPSPESWMWLVVIGVLGTLGQLILAQALKETEAGLVVPFDFFKLIWAAAFGYLFFAEVPDIFVWLGAAIVVAATSYLAYRESRLSKKGRPRPG